VLRSDVDVIDSDGCDPSVQLLFVFHDDLHFAVRHQPGYLARVSCPCHLFTELVGKYVREGVKQLRVPLVGRIAEHQSLVTCTHVFVSLVQVNCCRYLRSLASDFLDNFAGVEVKPSIIRVESDLFTHIPGHLLKVDLLLCHAGLAHQTNLTVSDQEVLTRFPLVIVSMAHFACGSSLRHASKMPSEIWSHSLSG